MTLSDTQRAFRHWLQRDTPPRFGDHAEPGLRIYRNNYRAQLVACLEESFPHTLSWIGGEAFHAAVATHVTRVPPSSWTLDAYASDFPETLDQLYPADPEVAELATIERALGDAFVGADADPVSAEHLADVDWDRAILRLTPTLDLCLATTNAAAIWSALAAGKTPPAVELLEHPASILVWRHDLVSRFRTIDAAEDRAIRLSKARTPFAALCAGLIEAHGETDGVALTSGYLGQWLADGLVVGVADQPCDAQVFGGHHTNRRVG